MAGKRKTARKTRRGDATHCVHAGEERHGRKAPLTTEIVQTSVFVFPTLASLRRYTLKQEPAYMYSRYGNPTTAAAEEKLAALEGGEACLVTASGMAAIHCSLLALCRTGDEIVSMLDVYGGTLRLAETVLPKYGIKTRFVPLRELDRVEKYFHRRTRALFLESPTNPTVRCVDLADLARRARKRGIKVIVDNTFATPVLQKPLALGADLVVHSATKYLGGHSDLTAGAVVGSRALVDAAREVMKLAGSPLDPGVGYLLLRGLKTLELRMARSCENAQRIAEALAHHGKVARVFYPGLPSHEAHALARRQMSGFGSMLAFEIKGGEKAAERFIDALRLWYLAPSLGGVESTVSYPIYSSHAGMSAQRLKLLGVSAATIRLSVGIEDATDLFADLEQALARV